MVVLERVSDREALANCSNMIPQPNKSSSNSIVDNPSSSSPSSTQTPHLTKERVGHPQQEDDGAGSSEEQLAIAKGGVACPFPWKLHNMLDAVVEEDLEHIVSWQPHGRAFRVHKPREFSEWIMPRFFGQTKYASFQRQLNLYGFARFAHGKDKGAYYHDCFVKGHRQAVRGMVRRKIKGTRVRRTFAPAEEPDFYKNATGTTTTLQEAAASGAEEKETLSNGVRSLSPVPSDVKSVVIPASPKSTAQVENMATVALATQGTEYASSPMTQSPVECPSVDAQMVDVEPVSLPTSPTHEKEELVDEDLAFFDGLPFHSLGEDLLILASAHAEHNRVDSIASFVIDNPSSSTLFAL